MASKFEWSYTEEPHATRRKIILEKHPEVKNYFGIDVSFKYVVLTMVVFQIFMAYVLQASSWALIILQAYFVSGTINHALTLAVHECSHNMAFGHNKILLACFEFLIMGFIANLPMGIPMSISFRKYHLEHHRNLGENILDTDIPTEFEARYFTGCLGKFIWLLLQPLFYAFRPFYVYKKAITDMEVLNLILQLTFNYSIYYYFGVKSLFYLIGGFVMGLSLHPLAAHFISDHYVFKSGQETYSYYGAINYVTFNVGHHVEHHDFPYVAGRNLPMIRKIANEFYKDYVIHHSCIKLMFDFIFVDNLSLRSRVKRKLASREKYKFYNSGAYSSAYCFNFVNQIIFNLMSFLKTMENNSKKKC